ncbi:unnamed protein product [Adineta steineri]|uniref:Uncharacterized protein n=1 Tax=Adineta steineri TaxID=433720 RepID=A0A818FUX6_9BILA|nr:unnamed protein product [Adineta steineri]CAF3478979.1 unnamed protein product [Adineta steineri]
MGSRSSKTSKSSRIPRLRVPKYDLNHFGVITVIFNPIKYKSRSELYHKFDEHMSRSHVTLLTVECIFELSENLDLPKQKFEITRPNDPRHLQIRAPSVLWLKENLINIAVKRLPSYIEYIAWLDADIEFERFDWPHLTIHQLQQYPIVQLFELSSFLGPAGKKDVLRQDYSFAYAIRHEQRLDARRSSECYVHPGYGWAMRRTVFENMGGLLDFSILGSGDVHFAYALINRIEETIPNGIHKDYRTLAKIWGQRVAQLSGNGSFVGYVPIHIYHYWHGNRVDRGYFERWSILENFQFSPLKDLEKNDQTGLIRLTERHSSYQIDEMKRLESFEKGIIAYFRSRNEDNLKKSIPAINTLKPKVSSSDIVRPSDILPTYNQTSWTTDVNQPSNDNVEYIHLQNMHSGHNINEQNSISLNNLNDSYNHTSSSFKNYSQGYLNHELSDQYINFNEENRNDFSTLSEQISF